ncbi:NAD(P)-binding oxidoreductase [Nonomuraea angiospora]|uniref:NAD(P)-binding oxidoreductase n=1 Tax=Nonomuraea angiospora TaxID=46172 RepID=UPI0029A593B6|nr:NAD(P)-binding oxidoreductase [Nonomuraea angiospora]MDX3101872.1 SDR family oxidoreductase [Nonomuraea angiospora]
MRLTKVILRSVERTRRRMITAEPQSSASLPNGNVQQRRLRESEIAVNVFVIGIAGQTGGLLARALRSHGDEVGGLVRREEQQDVLAAEGIDAVVGDLALMSSMDLTSALTDAEVVVARSGLDWLILRPSLLTDDPGTGVVSLGPAELHGQIPRADVAETLAALIHEPRIGRQILELNTGDTPIPEAVRRNIR